VLAIMLVEEVTSRVVDPEMLLLPDVVICFVRFGVADIR